MDFAYKITDDVLIPKFNNLINDLIPVFDFLNVNPIDIKLDKIDDMGVWYSCEFDKIRKEVDEFWKSNLRMIAKIILNDLNKLKNQIDVEEWIIEAENILSNSKKKITINSQDSVTSFENQVIKIVSLTFEEIYPFWHMLWDHLKEFEIKDKSSRLLISGFDEAIMINNDIKTTFFGAKINDVIVGVNSGFRTTNIHYRSRGLFVLSEHKMKGVATKLLKATQEQGMKEGCTIMWNFPKESVLPVYINFGFKVVSCFYKDLLGSNCYVVKVIQ